jgi:hypothetical protein
MLIDSTASVTTICSITAEAADQNARSNATEFFSTTARVSDQTSFKYLEQSCRRHFVPIVSIEQNPRAAAVSRQEKAPVVSPTFREQMFPTCQQKRRRLFPQHVVRKWFGSQPCH